jgi:hypothetical protein
VRFLLVGLAPAYLRWPGTTAVLAVLSVVASTAVMLTLPAAVNAAQVYRWSVWGSLWGFGRLGTSSDFAQWLQSTVYGWAGAGRTGGAALVALPSIVAVVLALQRPSSLSRS